MRAESRPVVIGIDGGGSKLRAMCSDLSGRVIGYAEGASAKPFPNRAAVLNGPPTLNGVLRAARRKPEDVVWCVAGLAGLDHEADQVWAEEVTRIPGMTCLRAHLNDAEVAHAGALLAKPGIVVVSGAGSIVWGRTEGGRVVRNYDFNHYAPTAARFLSYELVLRLISSDASELDRDLTSAVLDYWKVAQLGELAALAARNSNSNQEELRHAYGQMAPLVTSHAQAGSPLARTVCDEALDRMVTGTTIVATAFEQEAISVALVGGVARSEYFATRVTDRLTKRRERTYRVTQPVLSPVAGAVLLALERAGATLDDSIIESLRAHPQGRVPT
jgi:N-acetylglucosamine kinase-like BadF-type ATPase